MEQLREVIKCQKKSDKQAATDHRAELLKLIKKLSHKHSSWRVFEDFIAMAAFSVSNAVDWLHREKREAEYMMLKLRKMFLEVYFMSWKCTTSTKVNSSHHSISATCWV